jgi:hypothetical protein
VRISTGPKNRPPASERGLVDGLHLGEARASAAQLLGDCRLLGGQIGDGARRVLEVDGYLANASVLRFRDALDEGANTITEVHPDRPATVDGRSVLDEFWRDHRPDPSGPAATAAPRASSLRSGSSTFARLPPASTVAEVPTS